MRIRDLIDTNAIKLNVSVATKQDAIDMLVSLHSRVGNIDDSTMFKNAIVERETHSSTAVGGGVAVPHAKSVCVSRAGLSAITVPSGVDYGAPDGVATDIIFMIAAPPNGDVHLDILSRLMVLLMDENMLLALRNSKTVEEFVSIIDEYESKKYSTTDNTDSGHYRLLAVTACPTGIAHTYMAAEALEKAGKRLGVSIKVETNGSSGAKNVLTKTEIENADAIIIAADKNVDMARFDGKRVIKTSVSAGINNPDELIERATNGNATIFHSENTDNTYIDDGESFGRRVYKHLMNGVSHMLPFVVGGGVLIALGFLIDSIAGNADVGGTFGFTNNIAATVFWIGKSAFALMLPILSAYISQSIADRPGLLPGMVGGIFASNGYTLSSFFENKDLVGVSSAVSGFLGALLAGFVAGILVNGLKRAFSFMPKAMDGIKPVFIYPLFGTFLIGLIMSVVNPFIGILNTALSNGLTSLGTTSRILLSVVLAGMMAIDMGGPFNKAAYVFGTAAIADGNTWIMAAVMIGGMVPPIAIALSTTINKRKWTVAEQKNGPVNYLMGLCFITEGAIPYAASDPLRVIPSCIIGSATAGALTSLFRVACPAPHGGIFTFVVCDNAFLYLVALVLGSFVGAVMLGLLKKNV